MGIKTEQAGKIFTTMISCICSIYVIAQPVDTVLNSNGQQFHIQTQFLKVPDSLTLSIVVGVAVDADDNLYVLHRAGREWEPEQRTALDIPVVVKFSKTGAFINAWGQGFFTLPHMINIDRNNTIWIVDVILQQVLQFSQDGTLLRQLGEKYVAGDDVHRFDLPTDITFGKNRLFVADGYGNARVIHYSKNGKYVSHWGRKGTAPGELRIPHSITFYRNKLYVADRQNERLQVFNTKGKLLQVLDVSSTVGKPFGVTVSCKSVLYVTGFNNKEEATLILDKNLKVLHRIPFGAHDIAVDSRGVIYLARENDVTRITRKTH